MMGGRIADFSGCGNPPETTPRVFASDGHGSRQRLCSVRRLPMKLYRAFVTVLAFSCAAYGFERPNEAKPRVFITESHPLQVAGQASEGGAPLLLSGGTTKEIVEVMKSFVALCPEVIITSNREKASYVV